MSLSVPVIVALGLLCISFGLMLGVTATIISAAQSGDSHRYAYGHDNE